MTESGLAMLDRLEATAERIETPCGDGVLTWRRWGAGPPIVLLHGSRGAWSHWVRNVDALTPSYSVLAPDFPGCGDSAMPESQSQDGFVKPIAGGLDRILAAGEKVDIVGFSLGGVTGSFFARDHPERVRRLILVNTGGLGTPLGELNMHRVRGLDGEALTAAIRANLLELMIADPARVDDLALHLQLKNGLRARNDRFSFSLTDELLRILPGLTAQVDAIWGGRDRAHQHPEIQERALRSVAPDLEFHLIPDAGHWSQYERADAFNDILLRLLAKPLR